MNLHDCTAESDSFDPSVNEPMNPGFGVTSSFTLASAVVYLEDYFGTSAL